MVGRVVDRLGKGMRSAARDALLVSEIDREHRGRAIGLHRAADTTGAVIGPLLALGLLSIFDGNLRTVLWFAVIPGVLSTLLVIFVKDSQGVTPRLPKVKQIGEERALPKRVNQSIALLTVFSLLNFPDALILLHLGQIGFSISEVIGAYLLFNVSYAILSFPAGALADRFKPNQVYAFGLLVFAATYAGLALTVDKTISLVLVIVYGAFAAANDSVGKSWIAKMAPDNRQLWAQSLLQGLGGFAVLAAGIWAGLTWVSGPGHGSVPLLISGTLAIPIAVLMFRRH
jgi:MFS family permease